MKGWLGNCYWMKRDDITEDVISYACPWKTRVTVLMRCKLSQALAMDPVLFEIQYSWSCKFCCHKNDHNSDMGPRWTFTVGFLSVFRVTASNDVIGLVYNKSANKSYSRWQQTPYLFKLLRKRSFGSLTICNCWNNIKKKWKKITLPSVLLVSYENVNGKTSWWKETHVLRRWRFNYHFYVTIVLVALDEKEIRKS